MIVTLHRGGAALSAFRAERMLQTLQDRGIRCNSLSAQYVHILQWKIAPRPADLARMEALLNYGEAFVEPKAALEIAVVPRLGTISPWSSKATEIAQVCGLANLLRVERGIGYFLTPAFQQDFSEDRSRATAVLLDPLTESMLPDWSAAPQIFAQPQPRPLRRIPVLRSGKEALQAINQELGLALSSGELDYLLATFQDLGRDPTDVELMMFAQANSEHCRHKVFNARFRLDGVEQEQTLFGMIKETHAAHPAGTLSAYHDNAAVIAPAAPSQYFFAGPDGHYQQIQEELGILIKVETHNHPTAISPYPGAATGSGGEIRDEGATGRGGKAKMGLTGFSVSHLQIPGYLQAWESNSYGHPQRIRSALDIMLEGPIGAAAFNNEFGRPAVAGYFRVFETEFGGRHWGYHKPIMLAGGVGQIRPSLIHKRPLPVGAKILVIGGPAMLIGLGGGAASSMASGRGEQDLDFASVQRGNPEMQRRAQEVIERCIAMGDDSPILAIHDVGAGGLANAIPELLHDGGRGGHLDLRAVPNEDPAMSPMEIWCNEAQERYVLAVAPERLPEFLSLCARERCPVAVLGEATADEKLVLTDPFFREEPVDLSLDTLLGCPPKVERDSHHPLLAAPALGLTGVDLSWAAHAVLRHPTVASKEFLIHIGDRSVGGLIARDPMVGPWQVPVADCAVALGDYWSRHGEAMALGERAPVAVLDAPASGRLALAEALTNLFAADFPDLGWIKLSANWMAAVDVPGEDARLYDTVRSLAQDLCLPLELSIPVGKDSLSMHTLWQDQGKEKSVTSPVSLVITAVTPVTDVQSTWTPQLQEVDQAHLWLLDLGQGRLGASILAQVTGQLGSPCADLDDPALLRQSFQWLRSLRELQAVLAYHDRSDGGLWAAACEMSFASRLGLCLHIPQDLNPWSFLFAEEPGFLLQIAPDHVDRALERAAELGLADRLHCIAEVQKSWRIELWQGQQELWVEEGAALLRTWAEPSYRMQQLRDEPREAAEAFVHVADHRPLLWSNWSEQSVPKSAPHIGRVQPRVAVLREEGVNGHIEMAAAFARVGFCAVDVHMSDLLAGRDDIRNYPVFVACGGFSYGDVLGAGAGWANSILYHDSLREQFRQFFADSQRLALGICNGCQMLATLRELIPGSQHWPSFRRNRSEQFEARLVMVEVLPSPSPFFDGLAGLQAPIVIAHGEGRVEFAPAANPAKANPTLRYLDARGKEAGHYPANPNGSPHGLTGFCSDSGRVSILMPHPERVVRRAQLSWAPDHWGANSPWLEIFRNAFRAVS